VCPLARHSIPNANVCKTINKASFKEKGIDGCENRAWQFWIYAIINTVYRGKAMLFCFFKMMAFHNGGN